MARSPGSIHPGSIAGSISWLDPPWLIPPWAHFQAELLAPFGVKSTAGQEYDVENRRVTNYGEIAGQAAYFSVRNIFSFFFAKAHLHMYTGYF